MCNHGSCILNDKLICCLLYAATELLFLTVNKESESVKALHALQTGPMQTANDEKWGKIHSPHYVKLASIIRQTARLREHQHLNRLHLLIRGQSGTRNCYYTSCVHSGHWDFQSQSFYFNSLQNTKRYSKSQGC